MNQSYKLKNLLIALLFVFITPFANAQIIANYTDVDYVGNNYIKQKMDIYIPAGTTTKKPLIVFIHGGGWAGGAKNQNTIPFFTGMYNAGYICADINYRLSGDSLFPAQIYDCKTAIRFLKAHASQYFIDTCNVGLMGMSAGGHLASLLATSYGYTPFEGKHLGSTGSTSRVHAVVSLYGIYDFLSADGQMAQSCTSGTPLVHDSPTSPETQLLGCQISICPPKSNAANPMTYITANCPPFYLAHGMTDCTVPYGQSNELYNSLIAAGVSASVALAPGQPHAAPFFVTASQETIYTNFYNSKLTNVCGTTGVEKNTLTNFEVSPNPAKEFLNVRCAKEITKVIITDILGKITREEIIRDKTETIIAISDLENGIYFLTVKTANGSVTKKIIKD